MVDIVLFKKTVSDTGIPINTICERAGILRETYYNRLDNPNLFKVSEIENLTQVLGLTKSQRDKIFFAKECE